MIIPDRCFWAFTTIGLLGFYRFIAFIVIGPLGLWAFIVYVISYFGLSVYVVLYVSDFILYYGIQAWMWTFKYLYMDISDICTYRIIFTISKVTGVTFWYQSYLLIVTFYYVNRGVTFWYQSGFRPGSDPGWRFWRLGFIRFKRFLTISKYFGDLEFLKMKINRTFPFRITPF